MQCDQSHDSFFFQIFSPSGPHYTQLGIPFDHVVFPELKTPTNKVVFLHKKL